MLERLFPVCAQWGKLFFSFLGSVSFLSVCCSQMTPGQLEPPKITDWDTKHQLHSKLQTTFWDCLTSKLSWKHTSLHQTSLKLLFHHLVFGFFSCLGCISASGLPTVPYLTVARAQRIVRTINHCYTVILHIWWDIWILRLINHSAAGSSEPGLICEEPAVRPGLPLRCPSSQGRTNFHFLSPKTPFSYFFILFHL